MFTLSVEITMLSIWKFLTSIIFPFCIKQCIKYRRNLQPVESILLIIINSCKGVEKLDCGLNCADLWTISFNGTIKLKISFSVSHGEGVKDREEMLELIKRQRQNLSFFFPLSRIKDQTKQKLHRTWIWQWRLKRHFTFSYDDWVPF